MSSESCEYMANLGQVERLVTWWTKDKCAYTMVSGLRTSLEENGSRKKMKEKTSLIIKKLNRVAGAATYTLWFEVH